MLALIESLKRICKLKAAIVVTINRSYRGGARIKTPMVDNTANLSINGVVCFLEGNRDKMIGHKKGT